MASLLRLYRRSVALSALLLSVAAAAVPPPPILPGGDSLWKKKPGGDIVPIFIDPVPPEYAGGEDVIKNVIKEWADAQKPLGGLQLPLTPKKEKTRIHVKFAPKDPKGLLGHSGDKNGQKEVDPGFNNGKPVLVITIYVDPKLDAKGNGNVFRHELGHAEGLGHDPESPLMREGGAFDYNTIDMPIDKRNLAVKKFLWGSIAKADTGKMQSSVNVTGGLFEFSYALAADASNAGRITDFDVAMPGATDTGDFTVAALPEHWSYQFAPRYVYQPGDSRVDDLAPSVAFLHFFADDSSYGLAAGETGMFSLLSRYGSRTVAAASYSTNYDIDLALLDAPRIPEPATWMLMIAGFGMIGGALRSGRGGASYRGT